MPPHCDTLDGPVVKAARESLQKGNVNLILPWVHEDAEPELKQAFQSALAARKQGRESAEVADRWFYETAVRLHRQGENAPYTGLKPAGLDWGLVVPMADRAVESGDIGPVLRTLQDAIEEALRERFAQVMSKRDFDESDVPAARAYVQATLGFVLYAHHVYTFIKKADVHGEESTREHE